MNHHPLKLIPLAATLVCAASTAEASKIRFRGPANYELGTRITYRDGAYQSGRYDSLGSGYYHSGNIGMRWIDNRSFVRSGPLSFEFWALPYVGASSGPILATSSAPRILGGSSLYDLQKHSPTLYIERRRFPDINIWEWRAASGWSFKDSFTFSYREDL